MLVVQHVFFCHMCCANNRNLFTTHRFRGKTFKTDKQLASVAYHGFYQKKRFLRLFYIFSIEPNLGYGGIFCMMSGPVILSLGWPFGMMPGHSNSHHSLS